MGALVASTAFQSGYRCGYESDHEDEQELFVDRELEVSNRTHLHQRIKLIVLSLYQHSDDCGLLWLPGVPVCVDNYFAQLLELMHLTMLPCTKQVVAYVITAA